MQILVGTRQRDLTRGEAELAIQSPRPRQKDFVALRIARTSWSARSVVSWGAGQCEVNSGAIATRTCPAMAPLDSRARAVNASAARSIASACVSALRP